jgi:hypothetical protein
MGLLSSVRATSPELDAALESLRNGEFEAVARIYQLTGYLVGRVDALSSSDVRELILIEDAHQEAARFAGKPEQLALMREILSEGLDYRYRERALDVLGYATGHPTSSMPSGSDPEVALAALLRGPRYDRPSLSAIQAARAVLADMAAEQAIALDLGFDAEAGFAQLIDQGADGAAFVDWALSEASGIGEIFCEDEALIAAWGRAVARVRPEARPPRT